MIRPSKPAMLRHALLAATMLAAFSVPAFADVDDGRMDNEITSPPLPTGQHIAPMAATGSNFISLNPGLANYPTYLAGQAVKTVISPDGATLLVMTSGYNNLSGPTGALDPAGSNEYVFVFDIAGANKTAPKQTQVIHIPDTYVGLVFGRDGKTFYASGGVDDVVYAYAVANGQWTQTGSVKLGHVTGNGLLGTQGPTVSSLALSKDGTVLVAANLYNDSVSLIGLSNLAVLGEQDLRPGIIDPAQAGVAGGEYPFGVAVKGNEIAYVSSLRDREIDVVDVATGKAVVSRIAVPGNPNSMVLNAAQTRLYVAQDNTDTVAVIDTKTDTVIEEIRTAAPEGLLASPEDFTGAAPNALALSPDGKTLYVSNGGANSIAVVDIAGAAPHRTVGLIPTGWYPHSVSVSADGKALYVANGKSEPGPNPANLYGNTALLKDNGQTPAQNAAAQAASYAANQYIFQLEHAGLLSLPVPGSADLANLTRIVAANNGYSLAPNAHDEAVMGVLRQRIKHVIYIVKENRTYDQVLGDLPNGSNGDPALAEFGQVITPNLHRAALNFVTLDNFFDSGEVSGNGWPWTTSARETDNIVKAIPLDYASSPLPTQHYGRGAPYDAEGQNRGVDTGYPTVAQRQAADPRYPNDPNLLPGSNNAGAPDGPNGQKQLGYIWDSALRAGLTVRNYGFLCDLNRYNSGDAAAIPLDLMPAQDNPPVQVAYPVNPTLIPLTDIYFRGFDNAFPDIYREQEWAREFDGYVARKDLPNLSLVRLMHDHTGNFGTAILGVNFPEAQQADNDYAVGLLIDRVAHSPYKDNTLIFVIEDDAQDGPDHVDAHRSIGFVVGPYVKQHAVVSTRYSTVNMLRTMEDVLGIDHLNLNDAYQRPMTDVFDLNQKSWTFHAQGSTVLNQTQVARDLSIDFASTSPFHVAHPAAYWADATRGFDWSKEDRVPAVLFNQIVWKGLTNDAPYPALRDGADLRQNRDQLIQQRALRIGQTPTN